MNLAASSQEYHELGPAWTSTAFCLKDLDHETPIPDTARREVAVVVREELCLYNRVVSRY